MKHINSKAMNYQETEVKLYVPNLDSIRRRLEAAGAALVAPRVHETNVRYENEAKTLTGRGIVLRLRQDSRVRLTYKDGGKVTDGSAYARFEAEVEVSDFDAMHTILGKLGYQPSWRYEKYRTTYTLDGAEVVLDELPYGNFVEIEGDDAAITRARECLALTAIPNIKAGYAVLFEHVRRNLGLSFDDLTFANFDGITVPESAFFPPNLG